MQSPAQPLENASATPPLRPQSAAPHQALSRRRQAPPQSSRVRPSTARGADADADGSRPLTVSPPRAAIAARVLREEIESQQRVTRHAQREYNALKVCLQRKRDELELVRRHLRAFDVESLPVSPAGSAKSADDASPADQLKAEIHRVDGYKRRLAHLLERLRRHERFLLATLELLGTQQRQTQRECALFQDKLAMERKVCADLDCRRSQLAAARDAHETHAALQLSSLRDEIASRRAVHSQRVEADQRREEMLRLVEARPPPREPGEGGGDGRLSVSASASPTKRDSHSRRNSLVALLQDSAAFLSAVQLGSSSSDEPAPPPARPQRNGSHSQSSGTVATLLTAGGSSMLASSRRLHQLFQSHAQGSVLSELASTVTLSAHRESLLQIYETQYARVLRETGEADLSIVVDRFLTFHESLQRLQQIERELGAEHSALESRRQRQQQLVQRLRFSGIAEVEKRKRIRDFLEQQHYLKGLVKAQTKEAFVEQLRTFSFVQQGILNIAELLKCVDDRSAAAAALPVPPVTSGGGGGAAAVETDRWLSMIYYSLQVVRQLPPTAAPLSSRQLDRLVAIDPALVGVAAAAPRSPRQPPKPRGYSSIIPGPSWLPQFTAPDRVVELPEEEEPAGAGAGPADEPGENDAEADAERQRIKEHEVDTLRQVELLYSTLEAKHKQAAQEHSVSRLRRALGLTGRGSASASPTPDSDASVYHPMGPLTPEAKLAAAQAFFKEKRQRERQQLQQHQQHQQQFAQAAGARQAEHRPSGTRGMSSLAVSALLQAPRKRPTGVSFAVGSAASSSGAASVSASSGGGTGGSAGAGAGAGAVPGAGAAGARRSGGKATTKAAAPRPASSSAKRPAPAVATLTPTAPKQPPASKTPRPARPVRP
ncbi:hypothetical protein P43SY_008156 [Pythium insidiosum]|uniref:Uncharacterized protein n=1 Tax=Pythium insidiosum TaxID=114742 RepID=A0AAD5Q9X9_PYTIN|nr:hypothetical protein P43SY_008156 [Pythium insidiosum]